ncbi:hypothetical protein G7K_1194-t1 [Saitoella complicata NRRL Y-17804]|uniref:Uncharacterized protein n=1 Tax=Saitoella complicata (strain BCRC 22490 / CBS 7301 / JCM 7358 / NBRC 10748 / NRRL Y-17804) TaxID=698492 RepID=A0A0E9NC47_SAICN|nr:hypothetical protein G7K_1194-t1 [Saitoella complicata NRRL Y-17804]
MTWTVSSIPQKGSSDLEREHCCSPWPLRELFDERERTAFLRALICVAVVRKATLPATVQVQVQVPPKWGTKTIVST